MAAAAQQAAPASADAPPSQLRLKMQALLDRTCDTIDDVDAHLDYLDSDSKYEERSHAVKVLPPLHAIVAECAALPPWQAYMALWNVATVILDRPDNRQMRVVLAGCDEDSVFREAGDGMGAAVAAMAAPEKAAVLGTLMDLLKFAGELENYFCGFPLVTVFGALSEYAKEQGVSKVIVDTLEFQADPLGENK